MEDWVEFDALVYLRIPLASFPEGSVNIRPNFADILWIRLFRLDGIEFSR